MTETKMRIKGSFLHVENTDLTLKPGDAWMLNLSRVDGYLDPATPEVAELIRKAKAEAWNECVERVKSSHGIGIDPRYYRVWRSANPYQETGEQE
ncbi:hypothetical protein [Nesterenkonia rhizosphaerae]|uniref:hypothetical protein n=1 Tax=Nesterenkonia rhizosphaerae TaxID=1348272 RepID=UPI0031E8EAD1